MKKKSKVSSSSVKIDSKNPYEINVSEDLLDQSTVTLPALEGLFSFSFLYD
jgi:hypothetical protein